MKDKSIKYSSISLTDEEIAKGAYKHYFGGEAEQWEFKGAFQLALLRHLGLRPDHKLLDVGCGVLRGGDPFIRYLERGLYWGIDCNSDFIRAAGHVVQKDELLAEKNPNLMVINDFNFAAIHAQFDFVIAFSVLNHCDKPECHDFFRNIMSVVKDGTKILITHAQHVALFFKPTDHLQLNMQINGADDLPDALDPLKWRFTKRGDFFPVLELVVHKKTNEIPSKKTNDNKNVR